MLLVFWEQAGRKLSADQTALLSSDLHSTFLHLNETHRNTELIVQYYKHKESVHTSLSHSFVY